MQDWPDHEAVLVAFLTADLAGPVVTTETDNDLQDHLPLVQVRRAGGGDDGFRLDRALVDVDVYAASRADASALARQIRTALLSRLRGSVQPTAVVGLVATVSAPAWRPYENTGLRRVGATYEIYLHPVS
ncbi:hypothetical protein ACIQC7_27965 [Kitasatospora sp. NPDC088556]|uniref:hypothetical protein n=1 Tax=Kitasatospora sp. NPDC088556 TaxID=3364076 RepID=UPI0037F9736F